MLLKNAFFICLFICHIASSLFGMKQEDHLMSALLAGLDNDEVVFNPLCSPKSKKKKNRPASVEHDDSCEKEVEAAVLRAFIYDMELIQSMDEDQRKDTHSKIVSLLGEYFQGQSQHIDNVYTSTLVRAVNAADVILPRMNVPFRCNEKYILEYYNNAYAPDKGSIYAADDVIPTRRAKNAAKEYLSMVTKPISLKKRRKNAIHKLEACLWEYDRLKRS